MKKFIYACFMAVLLVNCSVDPIEEVNLYNSHLNGDAIEQQGNPHSQFGIPTVMEGTSTENSLEMIITAGERGATGGLSIRWMTLEDYETYGWNDDFAGNALLNGNSSDDYSLEEGEEFHFFLEDFITGEGDSWNRDLECGQTYVFIVQAHQDGKTQKSEYSEPLEASTKACDTCDVIEEESYSITYTLSEIDSLIDDISDIDDLYLALLDEGVDQNGTFSPTIEELLKSFNRNPYQSFTTTYIVGTEDCQDSVELTITITED